MIDFIIKIVCCLLVKIYCCFKGSFEIGQFVQYIVQGLDVIFLVIFVYIKELYVVKLSNVFVIDRFFIVRLR